jgi:Uma2 family endonuclease
MNPTTTQTEERPAADGNGAAQPIIRPIPPLRNGDRLDAEEFERRYDAMPDVKKAELIEGVVYMPSPVRADEHGDPQAKMIGWLLFYRMGTQGIEVSTDSTVRLDRRNNLQPDASLRILPAFGGQCRMQDGYIEGSVELAVEVSASTVSIDLHDKREAYRRNGVREYVVWRVEDNALDWLILRAGRYEPLAPGADGILRSEVFPGLWLDPAALLAGDLNRVQQVVQLGLATPEHADFVLRLREEYERRRPTP